MMIKRVLSVLLSVALLLCVMPLGTQSAIAETRGNDTYKEIDEQVHITESSDDVAEQGTTSYVIDGSKPATAEVGNPKDVVALKVEDTVVMWGVNLEDYYYWDCFGGSTYPVYAPDFTVTLRDGTTLTSVNGHICGDVCISLQYKCDESVWVLGGTYEVTASYEGITDTFNVTVVDTCIERIVISDIKIIENANGHTEYVYNEITGELETYYKYSYRPDFTIIFKDGTTFTGDAYAGLYSPWWNYSVCHSGGFEWVGDHPHYTDTQETEHWELGGTYEVTAEFFGVVDTFMVTVVENPVKEIVVGDITCTENQNGSWWDVYNEETGEYEEVYYYCTPSILEEYPKIILRDGSAVEPRRSYIGVYQVCLYGASYEIYIGDVVAGENTVTVSAFGESYEIPIHVTTISQPQLPIAKVEIADLSAFKNADGYIDIYPCYTVTLTDGRVFKNDQAPWLIVDGQSYWVPSFTMIGEDWQVGEVHTLTGSIGGVSDEFTVTVIDNPIQGITAKDVCIVDPTYSPLSDSIFYNKDTGNFERTPGSYVLSVVPEISVQLKDGDTVKLDPNALKLNDLYPINIYNNYVCGVALSCEEMPTVFDKDYLYTATLLGYSDEFNVRLEHKKITSVAVTQKPVKLFYTEGDSLDTSGMEVTAYYDDGTETIVTDYAVSGFDSTKVGEQTLTVTYEGITTTFVVTVQSKDVPSFVVDGATARAGETFTVAVRTQNNTGIVSLKLAVGYDGDVLELVSSDWQDFTDGVTGTGPITNNPFVINWTDSLSPNKDTDGVIALLTFAVKEGAAIGETAITVCYDPDDVYDENYDNVSFATVDGIVNVVEYISGDVNADAKINNKDLGVLLQYLNGWDVDVVEEACDVNRDGMINNKDLGILLQYLNGWDVELK